jgi:15-cis-phytoene synthase
VVTLYALDQELEHIALGAREPLAQEIRLTWWREALEAVFAGAEPPAQPTLKALTGAIRRHALPAAPFVAMIEARIAAIDAPGVAAGAAGVAALMELAAQVLDASAAGSPAIAPAARAWALRESGDLGAVTAALREARAGALPVSAFPAVAYVTLARAYARGREPSPLEKRLRLTTAVLTGRL